MKGTGADELRLILDCLNEWRGVGHLVDSLLPRSGFLFCSFQVSAWLFPLQFSGVLVQSDDELMVDAITGENQKFTMKDW